MKKTLLSVMLLVLTFTFQACVSVKVDSSKQASYTKKPRSVYIVVTGSKDMTRYNKELLSGLRKELTQKYVANEGYVRNPLSLESEEDINKKIADYNPDALLVIKQVHQTRTNNALTGARYELSLIDGETQKPVWKGFVDASASFGVSESVDPSVVKIIKKLEQDKII